MNIFAFSQEDLQGVSISELQEKIEKGFYDEGVQFEQSSYECPFILNACDFLDGYDKNGNAFLPISILARMILNHQIREIEDKKFTSIKGKELEKITEKIIKNEIKRNGYRIRKGTEEYKWLENYVKSDLLDILTAENEEKAVEKINQSIFFSEEEKKAAKVVLEKKNFFLCDVPSIVRGMEATKQKAKVGERVEIRVDIFLKRYKVTKYDYASYIDYLTSQVAELEAELIKKDIDKEKDKKLEEYKETLNNISEIQPDGIYKKEKTKNQILKITAIKVLQKVTGEKELKDMKISQILDNLFDPYVLLVYLNTFIRLMSLNSVSYTLNRLKVDPVVRKLMQKRMEKVTDALAKLPVEKRRKIYEKFKYKKQTIYHIETLIKNKKEIKNGRNI